MFRSGRLTATRLNQIMRWVERMPHNLKAVAKACTIYPADLMAWYVAGQDPDCRDPLMKELAWRIAEVRAEAAARNYERIVAAADGGQKRKVVTKPGGDLEETVEDVLPAAWAIERLEKMAGDSVWEISPNAEQAAELHAMMRELEPTPLLPSGTLVHEAAGELPGAVQPLNGPLPGGDDVGQVELPHGVGQAAGDGDVPQAQAVGGGNGVDSVEAAAVGVESKFDVVHTQSLTDD